MTDLTLTKILLIEGADSAEKAAISLDEIKNAGESAATVSVFIAETMGEVARAASPFVNEGCGFGIFKRSDGSMTIIGFGEKEPEH